MSQVLFLCSGNFYRSRFAEAWFNHRAMTLALRWRARSRALLDIATIRAKTRGPISPLTVDRLHTLGVDMARPVRHPIPLRPDDLHAEPYIIAMSRREHQPMLAPLDWVDLAQVTFWEIGDADIENPTSALERIEQRVDTLLDSLQRRVATSSEQHPRGDVARGRVDPGQGGR